ncbi:GNAT family N-acetyltransferase [Nocardioides sp.]|uniref:GNAT family N-acetyltransferase n=1 Tax=Nocardioides sp. TaxID=35761 RepID=UPI002735FEE5|nr:GNAT family N-acetyltransferase [Nocardioides sp.]MDP3893927.1 GNAT family N-acetyltransferase [Nocardioides sp.]
MRIREVDLGDDSALAAFHAVQVDAMVWDRPSGWIRPLGQLVTQVQAGSPYYRPVLVAAVGGDGRFLGVAESGFSLQDNTHLADLEIAVRPEVRRRGVGRALMEHAERRWRTQGCTSVCGELHVPSGSALDDTPGYLFGRVFGFDPVHQEDHLVLDLPVDGGQLVELAARAEGIGDEEIVTWLDSCPDELVGAYAALRTQMENDVPIGDVDYEPVVVDEARIRSEEARTRPHWVRLVAAARRRGDGTMSGYSCLLVSRSDHHVVQDDTLVMPEHRGHRLGTRLKLATLRIVQSDFPEHRMLHTWTDPDNHAMYRTNTDFGFVARERMHELQRKDG